MLQLQAIFKSLVALPPSVIGVVVTLIGQLIEGVEKVLHEGTTQTIDLHVNVFGRRLGFHVEIALLDKK